MSYVEKHLIEGETIIYETRLHWIMLIGPVLLGFLFGLTGVGMFVLSARGGVARDLSGEFWCLGAPVFRLLESWSF